MEFPIKFETGEDSPLYIPRGHRLWFPKQIIFLLLKIDFVLANSADPDEMLHNAAFHLGVFTVC